MMPITDVIPFGVFTSLGETMSAIVASDPAFSERLRQLREKAGLSQYALAQKSGISAQAISKLEKGDNEPTWETVRKLARALGVGVEKFDAKEDDDKPDDEPSATPAPKKPTPRKPKK